MTWSDLSTAASLSDQLTAWQNAQRMLSATSRSPTQSPTTSTDKPASGADTLLRSGATSPAWTTSSREPLTSSSDARGAPSPDSARSHSRSTSEEAAVRAQSRKMRGHMRELGSIDAALSSDGMSTTDMSSPSVCQAELPSTEPRRRADPPVARVEEDGGVRLAGGPPDESVEDDVQEAVLPPPYQRY